MKGPANDRECLQRPIWPTATHLLNATSDAPLALPKHSPTTAVIPLASSRSSAVSRIAASLSPSSLGEINPPLPLCDHGSAPLHRRHRLPICASPLQSPRPADGLLTLPPSVPDEASLIAPLPPRLSFWLPPKSSEGGCPRRLLRPPPHRLPQFLSMGCRAASGRHLRSSARRGSAGGGRCVSARWWGKGEHTGGERSCMAQGGVGGGEGARQGRREQVEGRRVGGKGGISVGRFGKPRVNSLARAADRASARG